jgi:hypothetical protein
MKYGVIDINLDEIASRNLLCTRMSRARRDGDYNSCLLSSVYSEEISSEHFFLVKSSHRSKQRAESFLILVIIFSNVWRTSRGQRFGFAEAGSLP